MTTREKHPNPSDSWTAPEHSKARRYMVKDLNRQLIVDARPAAMNNPAICYLRQIEIVRSKRNRAILEQRRLSREEGQMRDPKARI